MNSTNGLYDKSTTEITVSKAKLKKYERRVANARNFTTVEELIRKDKKRAKTSRSRRRITHD